MKKIKLLGCIIGLLISIPTSFGAVSKDICDASPPPSCFYADKDGNQHKIITNTPTHCPDSTSSFGIKEDNTTYLNLILFYLGSKNTLTTQSGMELLQEKLLKSCGWVNPFDDSVPAGPGCAPLGASIPETDDDDSLAAKCDADPKKFIDGKYGICTREAVRRYIAWEKVTTPVCDNPLILEIIPPNNPTENEETFISIGFYPSGSIWTWAKGKEDDFIAIDIVEEESIEITDVKVTTQEVNQSIIIHPDVSIGKEDGTVSGTFSSGEITVIAKSGIFAQKTVKINETEAKFYVYRKDNPTNFSCDQLLPRYLVGATCNNELHGDARDITYWIQRFSGQITSFIAAFAVLLISWNAFGLVMSAGDSDQIATNKKAIMWVGIGLLLVIFAYVIVKTIISLSFS